MSTGLGVAIMMNNYFHDVATALLLASGLIMWILVRRYDERPNNNETAEYLIRIYKSVTRIAVFSLVWIVIGGIPRTLAYKEFEWANAAGKDQIPALIVKHVLAFIFVGCGAYIWIRLSKKIKQLKS